jgi:hypothetical protein
MFILLSVAFNGMLYGATYKLQAGVGLNNITGHTGEGRTNISPDTQEISGGYSITESPSSKMGVFIGGATMIEPEDSRFMYEIGARYFQRGYDQKTSSTFKRYYGEDIIITEQSEFNASYLEFNGKGKYPFTFTEMFSIEPYVGIGLGFLLSSELKTKTEYQDTGWSRTEKKDMNEEMNGMDFGLLLGLDVVIMQRFIVGFEWNKGLSSFPLETATETFYNSYIISLGYKF